MADKEVSFRISAKDDATSVFLKAQRAMKSLNDEAAKEESRRSKLGVLGRAGEDLKALKRNPTIEGLEQIGKIAKGGAAIAVAYEAARKLEESLAGASEAEAKLGKGAGLQAFLEKIVFTVPLVKNFYRNVLGDDTTDDLIKKTELKAGLVEQSIKASDAINSLRFDVRASQPGGSAVGALSAGIEKAAFNQIQAIDEQIEKIKSDMEDLWKSDLFQNSANAAKNFKPFEDAANQNIKKLQKQQEQIRTIEENQKQQLFLDARQDQEKRAKQSELKIVSATGDIRRKGMLIEATDARDSLRLQTEAELDAVREATRERVEIIRQGAIDERKGRTREEAFAIGRRAVALIDLTQQGGDAQQAAIRRRANLEDAAERARLLDKQFSTSQQLLKSEQERLSVGDALSQQAAKQLEISIDFNARRKQLLDIISDIDSTGAEKGKAFQEGLALDVQERLAKQLALTPTFRGSTASANTSPFTTGQAEAAREKVVVDPKVLALMKEMKDDNAKQADKIGEAVGKALAAVFGKLPALKGIFGLN